MTELDEKNVDRDAALAELRRYLTKLVRDFDAAGLTDRARRVSQSGAFDPNLASPPFDQPELGQGSSDDQGRDVTSVVQDLPGRSSIRELKLLQNDLMQDISEVSQSVANSVGASPVLSSPPSGPMDADVEPPQEFDDVSDTVGRLYEDILQELQGVARDQEEALSKVRGDLLRMQKKLQDDLYRIADHLELNATVIEDYLNEYKHVDTE